MNTKPILAYDCACVGASVALRVDGRTHVRTIEQSQQAADLVPVIDALLKEHHVRYADLGTITTTTGPGSFTGVRIGLAALRGFVAAHATPVKLLTTLEAIAWAAMDEHSRFTVTLRAGKGEIYAQHFMITDARPVAISQIMLSPETRTDWPLPCINHYPVADAALMADLAEKLPTSALTEAVPHYIRPPDAIVPKPYTWLPVESPRN